MLFVASIEYWLFLCSPCSDVNECEDGTAGCPAHSTCSNTDGSYNCHCESGYIENGNTCEGTVLTKYTCKKNL